MEAKNNNDATLTLSILVLRVPLLWRIFTHLFFRYGHYVPVWRFALPDRKRQINAEYVKHYTNASLLVRDDLLSKTVCSAATTLKNGNTINVLELSVR